MYHEKQKILNKVVGILISFLMLFTDVCPARANGTVPGAVTDTCSAAQTVSDAEVTAFKVGALFSIAAGFLAAVSYLPIKEVKHAVDYRSRLGARYRNFVKSFSNFLCDKELETFAKQEGCLWDWAACLECVINSQKQGVKFGQKDIVKKLFGKCAFFEHNRKEYLPVNEYYDSSLLEALNKLSAEHGMTFERELWGFGLAPKSQKIKDKIEKFYSDNENKPFVINDSYFYNEEPFIHFVVISEIDSHGIVTVKDPAVGLIRKQPIDTFCQGYIHDNGYAKLPSLDMFTLRKIKV